MNPALFAALALAAPAPLQAAEDCRALSGFYVCDEKDRGAEWDICPDIFAKIKAGQPPAPSDAESCRLMSVLELRVDSGLDGTALFSIDPEDARGDERAFYKTPLGAPIATDRHGRKMSARCEAGTAIAYFGSTDYGIATEGFAVVDGQKTRFVPFLREEIERFSLMEGGIRVSRQETKLVSRIAAPGEETFDVLPAARQPATSYACRSASPGETEHFVWLKSQPR